MPASSRMRLSTGVVSRHAWLFCPSTIRTLIFPGAAWSDEISSAKIPSDARRRKTDRGAGFMGSREGEILQPRNLLPVFGTKIVLRRPGRAAAPFEGRAHQP